MIHLENTVIVDRPLARVWAFVTDSAALPRWQGENVEPITPGPLRPGSEFREVVKMAFWTMEVRCRTREVEPGKRMTFEATSSFLAYDSELRFEEVGPGTRVTFVVNARLLGLWRLLRPMLAMELRHGLQGEGERLKQAVEEPAAVVRIASA